MRTLKNDFLKSTALISALTLGLISSSCGNNLGLKYGKGSSESHLTLADGVFDGPSAEGEYDCPAGSNVLPVDNKQDGLDVYKACASRVSTANLLIHGKSRYSGMLCVFPAQYVDDEHYPLTKPDLATQLPMMSCSSPTSGGLYATFPGVSFNYVYIVNYPDRNAMQSCLAQANPWICPAAYSYGKFR